MRLTSKVVLAALASLVCSNSANAQLAGSLTVEVEGLRNQAGNMCIKIFNGSQGFPNDNDSAVRRQCVAIAANLPKNPADPFSVSFENLKSGAYAVAIYHDSNSNEQLNRGTFGMPTEGYGFSNDAPANAGPPDYKDAVFLLAGSNTTIQIHMQYPQ